MLTTNRSRWFAANLILAAVVVAWQAAAVAEKPPRAESRLTPEVVEDILRLRRALLGNVSSDDDTRPSSAIASEDQFRSALTQLAAEAPATLPAPTELEPPVVPPHATEGQAPAQVVEVDLRPAAPFESPDALDPDPDLALVLSLRSTSRMLDNRAHDLDAEQRFDTAERLRRLATRLRREAREIERATSAAQASPPVN